MEETLEEKQKYLRENILNKGYDVDKFTQFLISKKGEAGLDINNWIMSELVEVSNEFIKQYPNNSDNNKNENENSSNKINDINENENSSNKINEIKKKN